MSKDAITIRNELAKPFAPEDLEWRLQQAFEESGRGLAVPYVTNRAIQDRLDDVVGPENWQNEFRAWHSTGKRESQICGISIFFEGRGFVTKWDGAEDTDIESIKGGLSDSMKRAAVQWGIGRVLYKMDVVWVDIERRGKSWVIKEAERKKLDKAYTDMLRRLSILAENTKGVQSGTIPSMNAAALEEREDEPNPDIDLQQKDGKNDSKVMLIPGMPAWEYTVMTANIQPGRSQNASMNLTLKDRGSKTLRAFVRGINPALTPGVKLADVKLTLKQQDNVAFYVLESFSIVSPMTRAA